MSKFQEKYVFEYSTHVFDITKLNQYGYIYDYKCRFCNGNFKSWQNYCLDETGYVLYFIDEYLKLNHICLTCDDQIIRNIIE